MNLTLIQKGTENMIRILALLSLTLTHFAVASESGLKETETMMKSKNCFTCHAIDKKLVGPAFNDVAAKYTEEDIPALIEKIMRGTKGTWGPIPMPPNPVTAEQAESAAKFILMLK